ncbi:MAG: hypothetical protein CSA97_01095 [Bacteroidetes bacterium]|nr:MAG: hypothetical protein CSA97_01095 [Bacteroidota bacterium]
MRRIRYSLLLLATLLVVLTPGAWATEITIGPITYEIVGNEAHVKKWDQNSTETSFTIPGVVDGDKTVTKILDKAIISNKLTFLYIPGTVKHIGNQAVNCDKLGEISLNEGLESLADEAFYPSKLTEVWLPASVKEIGYDPFHSSVLTKIDVASGNTHFSEYNDDGVLYSKDLSRLIQYPAAKADASYTLPSATRTIGRYAMANAKLEALTLNEGLEKIEKKGLFWMRNLTSLSLPSTLTTLKWQALKRCLRLENLHIGKGLSAIGNEVFSDCNRLQQFTINAENPNYTVEDGVLYNKQLTRLIKYPAGKTNTEYEIVSTTKKMDGGAFMGNTHLQRVVIPEGCTSVSLKLFMQCSALEECTLPSTITSIGQFAFWGTNITSLTIPAGIKSLDTHNIGLNKTTELTILARDPATITTVNNNSFTLTMIQKCTLKVPYGSKGLYEAHPTFKLFENVGQGIVELPEVKVAEVSFDLGDEVDITVGEEKALPTTINPLNADNKNLFWKSSDTNVATVTQEGKVNGVSKGDATITVTATGSSVEATCTVHVLDNVIAVTSVTVSPQGETIYVGDPLQLTATVEPNNATGASSVVWTSADESVATVNPTTGQVTGVGHGSTDITATAGGVSGTTTVNVRIFNSVLGFAITPTVLQLAVNGEETLMPVFTPSNATNQKVSWASSDASIASVDDAGKVTAKQEGTATITGTTEDGGLQATCAVTVGDKITNITLVPATKTLKVGEDVAVSAAVEPATSTAKLLWNSSDASVATVSVDPNDSHLANIKAVGEGECDITASSPDGTVAGTCHIVAEPVAVTGINITPETYELQVDETATPTVSIEPSNATNKGVSWSVAPAGLAKVTGGKIIAMSAGTATLTATTEDGGFTATCTVEISDKPTGWVDVDGVSLDATALEMKVGEEKSLVATVEPEDASDKTVSWESDNEDVITVDTEGKLTAVGTGTAIVTVTTKHGMQTAECTVNVYAATPVESVSLDATSLELKVGEEKSLVATIAPEDATIKTVSWASSDESVATVDASGKVVAVAAGTATITVTTVSGAKSADCTVTVATIEGETPIVDKKGMPVELAQGKRITVTPNPAGGTISVEGLEAGVEVCVYSAMGQLMMRQVLAPAGRMDISQLAPGLYVLRANGAAVRFVKQ